MKLISNVCFFLCCATTPLSQLYANGRPLFLLEYLTPTKPAALSMMREQMIYDHGIPESFITEQKVDKCLANRQSFMHLCFDQEGKGEILFKREDVLAQSFTVFSKITLPQKKKAPN